MKTKLFRGCCYSVLLGVCSCVGAIKNDLPIDSVFSDQPCDYDDISIEKEALNLTRSPGGQKLIDYVKNKYEVTVVGRQCLFYPAKNAKRLVISFGYGGVGNVNYFLWSWFWRNDEAWDGTAYLFVRDLDDTWYFGNKNKSYVEDYSSIINYFMQLTKVPKEHVFAVGLSMGGAVAVFYSVLLKLRGALVINPVLDKRLCALEICPRNWRELISKCCWRDVFELIKSCDELPRVSLLFGTEKFDEFSAYSVIDAFKKQSAKIIIRHANVKDHVLLKSLNISRSFIDNEIEYLDQESIQLGKIES